MRQKEKELWTPDFSRELSAKAGRPGFFGEGENKVDARLQSDKLFIRRSKFTVNFDHCSDVED